MADPQFDAAKASFLREKELLIRGLANVPDDRLNWSPSPTSRTPIQIVAHAAESLGHIVGMLDGRPFPVPTTAEADRGFRENDRRFTTREAVLAELEAKSAAYVALLDALTPERLDSTITFPFGLGTGPLTAGLTAAADHTRWHTAQLDYIQTIYGDQVWH